MLHDMYSDVGSVIGSYTSHSRWIVLCPTGVLYGLNLVRVGMNVCAGGRGSRKDVPLVGHAAHVVAQDTAVGGREDGAEGDGCSDCGFSDHVDRVL